jgi:hypothetical protein
MKQYQALQTTANSAFDGPDGTFGAYKHWANYFNFTGENRQPNTRNNPLYFLQFYKNPAMYNIISCMLNVYI